MTQLTDLTARLEAFEAYAQMLAHRFDVRVIFEGTEADTNGKVIRLPILETLTENELDMLYGILLHEVGHVRYSDFSDAAFALLRHSGDFYLANAIEDARVEAMLMQEFAGAGDIFNRLYREHAADRRRMARLFGPQHETPVAYPERDVLYAIGRLLHARLHPLQLDPPQGVGPTALASARTLLTTAGLLGSLKPGSVRSWTWPEVVSLAQRAFDAWAATGQAAPTTPIQPQAQEAAKAQAVQQLQELQRRQQDLATARVAHERRLTELRRVQAPAVEAAEATLAKLEPQRAKAERAAETLADLTELGEAAVELATAVQEQRLRVQGRQAVVETAYATKRAALQAKQQTVAEQLSALEQAGRSPARQRQLRERLSALEAQMEALQPSPLPQTQVDRLARLEQDLAQVRQQLADLQRQAGPRAKLEAQAAQLQALEAAAASAEATLNGFAKAQQQHRQEIQAIAAKEKTLVRDGFQAVREVLTSGGLPASELLPTAPATPGWEAVDAAQAAFDEKASADAGTLVIGGVGISPGTRQMAMLIDQTVRDVEAIDVVTLLQEQFGASPLARFRDTLGRLPNEGDDDQGGAGGGARPYRVWSTAHDALLPKTAPTAESRLVHQADLTVIAPIQGAVRQLIASRFAFSTRDRFHGGQEEGQLDQRSLWRLAARQGDTFFEINRPVPVNRSAVSILLDLSGSLDRAETGHGALQRQIALALSDALERVHVRHEILGFHAPVEPELLRAQPPKGFQRRVHRLEHWVFRDWKGKGAAGLGHALPQCTDNADGESIRFAWQRLRRQGAQRKIVIIISDARPWLDGAETQTLDADVRQACAAVRAAKGEVLALSVGADPAPLYGPRSLTLHTLAELPGALAALLPARG